MIALPQRGQTNGDPCRVKGCGNLGIVQASPLQDDLQTSARKHHGMTRCMIATPGAAKDSALERIGSWSLPLQSRAICHLLDETGQDSEWSRQVLDYVVHCYQIAVRKFIHQVAEASVNNRYPSVR